MAKYRLKSPTLDAEKWNPEVPHPAIKVYPKNRKLGILTQQHYEMIIHEGDYLIYDEVSKMYSISPPELFEAMYEQVRHFRIKPCAESEFVEGLTR